jgi:hypothetical protein
VFFNNALQGFYLFFPPPPTSALHIERLNKMLDFTCDKGLYNFLPLTGRARCHWKGIKAPNLRPARKGPGGPTISQKERVSLSTECPSCTRRLVVVVSGERTQGGTTAKSQRIRKNLILHDDGVMLSATFSG